MFSRYGLMRIERVILEHHGDVALARRELVDHAPADMDFAVADRLQPRHHAQQRGFAATGGPDQRDELAVAHVDRDAMEDFDRPVGLAHVDNLDRSHFPPRTLKRRI